MNEKMKLVKLHLNRLSRYSVCDAVMYRYVVEMAYDLNIDLDMFSNIKDCTEAIEMNRKREQHKKVFKNSLDNWNKEIKN